MTVCLWGRVRIHLSMCVLESHLVQSGLCMHVRLNMNMSFHVCPSRAVFLPTQDLLSIFYNMTPSHTHAHTRFSIPLHFEVWSGGFKWQVFNQHWPPHAIELIRWTRLNPQHNLPPPFHLIHPLTGRGCHTQVAVFRDSLTNNMWEVEGRRRLEDKEWEVLCLQYLGVLLHKYTWINEVVKDH